MVTISSISTFKTDKKLLGCGIDAELIHRFARWTEKKSAPPPFLFSENEIEHCRSLSDPAKGLCASFCCKEAVFKALMEPYNWNECELFWTQCTKEYKVHFSEQLCMEFKIEDASALVEIRSTGECLVQVYIFG
jgi:phosphopantetheinyl transferase (holo-ACP synthase)